MSNNPWKSAVKQVENVREYLEMSDEEFEKLITHDRVLKKDLKLKMDDGSEEVFKAFRGQHNNLLGPYKGGIRYHPQVSEDEVKALSMWMSWKCSLAGLPLGGGKGGVIVDPHKLSEIELEKLSRAWVRAFAKKIGPEVDVPAPDVNTNGQIMVWMADEYIENFKSQNPKAKSDEYNKLRATFTGKPVENGGSLGRIEATGRGGFFVLENLVKKLKLKKEETTIAVQGLGNVGFWFAKLASEAGYKVVAVSDSKGGIVMNDQVSNPKSQNGLDVDNVMAHKKAHGSLKDYEGVREISNEELLELDVDILVPSALEGVIHKGNSAKIKAKAIIEMANGPVTPEADVVLTKKGIVSVPDILSNSGGVSVSYFEWKQNLDEESWSEEKVNKMLQDKMDEAFLDVWEEYERLGKNKVSMRVASYVVGVGRVLRALRESKE